MKNSILGIIVLLLLLGCDETKDTTENIIETELLISNNADYLHTYTAEGEEIHAAYMNRTIKLLTTQNSYSEAVVEYDPNIKVDDLNFSNGNVLLIDMGQKGSIGYVISTKIVEIESYLLVNIEYCTPPILSDSPGRPHQFIWIPSKKEIEISERNVDRKSCK